MRPLDAPARLAAQQTAFAAHLRDPTQPPPADIEPRRMAVYRELFYNSLESLLANNFPVIRALRGDVAWHALVRAFYREHAAHTPLFPQIASEFLAYLQARAARGEDDPPFLVELAHYEWVELALSIDGTDLAQLDVDADGDLLDGVPVLSPLAWPLAYRFPVQQIRAEFQPTEPPEQPTCLLLVRDREDRIRFKSIDPLAYTLLQALADNDEGASGRALLTRLAAQSGSTDTDAFIAAGLALLQQLRERQAILGTVR